MNRLASAVRIGVMAAVPLTGAAGCDAILAADEARATIIAAAGRGQSSAGTPLHCSSTFRIDRWVVTREARTVRYRANAGGDVGVATLLPSGDAIESIADWSGMAAMQRLSHDSIEVQLFVGSTIEPTGVVRLRGRRGADGRVRGPYTCSVRGTHPVLELQGTFVLSFL